MRLPIRAANWYCNREKGSRAMRLELVLLAKRMLYYNVLICVGNQAAGCDLQQVEIRALGHQGPQIPVHASQGL